MRPRSDARRLHAQAEALLSRVEGLLVAVEEDLEATSVERASMLDRGRRASGLVQQALWLLEEGDGRFVADAQRLVGEGRDAAALLEAEVMALSRPGLVASLAASGDTVSS